MRPKIKEVTRLVRIMKDPDPRFVSLVDHGANQTPFAVVKRAQRPNGKGATEMLKRASGGGETRVKKGSAKPVGGLLSVKFLKSEFDTEKAVKSWLDEFGYEGYKIVAKKDSFEAVSEDLTEDDFEGGIREVAANNGVIARVGKLKSDRQHETDDDEDTDEGDEPDDAEARATQTKKEQRRFKIAAKGKRKPKDTDNDNDDTKSKATKFDPWGAYLSGGDSLKDVLEDAMKDGVPPGFFDIMYAAEKSIANVLKNDNLSESEREKKLTGIGQEIASIVMSVDRAYRTILEDDDEEDTDKKAAAVRFGREIATVRASKRPVQKGIRAWVKVEEIDNDKHNADKVDVPFKLARKLLLVSGDQTFFGPFVDEDEDEDGADEEKTKKTAKNKQTSASSTGVEDIKKALGDLGKNLEDIASTVKKSFKKHDDAATTIKDIGDRLSAIEGRAPSKKGTSEDEPDNVQHGDPEDAEDAKFSARLKGNLMGLNFGIGSRNH